MSSRTVSLASDAARVLWVVDRKLDEVAQVQTNRLERDSLKLFLEVYELLLSLEGALHATTLLCVIRLELAVVALVLPLHLRVEQKTCSPTCSAKHSTTVLF